MFRTVIIRNENVLRKSIHRVLNRNLVQALSIQCLRKCNQPRSVECCKHTTASVWKIDTVRQYCSNFPAHTKVNLPALSPTMEQGTIVSWEKKEGDKLNEGDLLAEIETDKATMGFETPEEGYLAKILIPAGSKDVPIGKLVCIIVENQADVGAFKDFKDTGETSAAKPAATPPPAQAPAATPVVAVAPTPIPTPSAQSHQMTAVEQRGERVYASPMAKKLAEAQKLRIEGRGSGLFGSITSKDIGGLSKSVEAKAASAGSATIPKGAAYIDIPVSNIRAVIAKRLLESKITIPHYYVSSEINVDAIIKLREKINKEYEKKGIKLSMNDFIVKALSIACTKVPETNSAWLDKIIRQFDSVDVSVAVSTDKGLITPILFNADRKGLFDISKEVKVLANKAREGKLQPHEFQGGTITLSNLGMFGVSHFNAIINPPQSVIVATGATESRMIPDPKSENGWKVAQFMTATVSCDHRVVDGALAAQWLQYFKKFLEDPTNMLL